MFPSAGSAFRLALRNYEKAPPSLPPPRASVSFGAVPGERFFEMRLFFDFALQLLSRDLLEAFRWICDVCGIAGKEEEDFFSRFT